jgi:glutathione S-transferase
MTPAPQEESAMLALYHNPFSTCSQKVRLALAEKKLDFVSHEIDLIGGAQHDPEYVKLNPNHVVPTLVHDGRVLVESTLINEYVDEAFDGPALRPADAAGRHAVRLWTHLLDARIHPAAPVITFAMGPRNLLLAQPQEVREANIAAIPDPHHRAIRRSVLEHGVDAPEFLGALRTMIDMLDRAETTLASQPWLSGKTFGLADAGVLPYVLRLDHLAMDALLAPETRPKVADWYARVQARQSYATAVAAWLPQAMVDFLRMQGRELWPVIEARLAEAH